MSAPDWEILPRETDLSRSRDPMRGWSQLTLVERHNTPHTWTVEGSPEAIGDFVPGMGTILIRNGVQIVPGKLTGLARSATVGDSGRVIETATASFASDLRPIGNRVVLPSPSFVMSPTIFHFPAAYDLRTGPIETLLLGYIRSNAGDLAQANRRVPRLRVPTSLGRGGNTQVSGRFDHLGVLSQTLAEAGNLRLGVQHNEDSGGGWIDLTVDTVADLSDNIRFGAASSTSAGLISEWRYEIGVPITTRAIVAGGGELAARDILQMTAPEAEALWNDIAETLIDQRQVDPTSTDKLAELTRAAQEAIDEGVGLVKVSFSPMLGPDLEYRRDVRVGDIVGYDLPGLDPAKDKIREATTVVTVEDGQPTERVTVVVGTPDAPATSSQQQTARALRTVNVIQRSQ